MINNLHLSFIVTIIHQFHNLLVQARVMCHLHLPITTTEFYLWLNYYPLPASIWKIHNITWIFQELFTTIRFFAPIIIFSCIFIMNFCAKIISEIISIKIRYIVIIYDTIIHLHLIYHCVYPSNLNIIMYWISIPTPHISTRLYLYHPIINTVELVIPILKIMRGNKTVIESW